MTTNDHTCATCDQPIAPDDGGAVWYHTGTMSAFCDPEGEERLDRQADPAPLELWTGWSDGYGACGVMGCDECV